MALIPLDIEFDQTPARREDEDDTCPYCGGTGYSDDGSCPYCYEEEGEDGD